MNIIKSIRTEEEYRAALERIEEIFHAEEGTPEEIELDVLADLVTVYEAKHYYIEPPDPIAAIEFRMDQAGLTPRDLEPFIGSRAKVAEVLTGKRPITMSMAIALHTHLGIPADVLLQRPSYGAQASQEEINPERFPLKAMAKVGWIPNFPDLMDRAKEIVDDLIHRAGGMQVAHALYRKNDDRRINAKTDEYSLKAWCLQVMATTADNPPSARYIPGTIDADFLNAVARLSSAKDGPIQARDLLADKGVGFAYIRHLPRTHLDGAALRLADGRPVIGLTLRYDRIDNFWFTLLHELAHVGLHMDIDPDVGGFVDDHTLRNVQPQHADSVEQEADRLAQDALIPPDLWNESFILAEHSPMAVMQLAAEAGVHPAIVAGRVRRETGNYRLLSQFVGSGKVRRQFEDPAGN